MADASAPESVRPDAGTGFRFEMALQNAVLGYWPHALALLGLVLAVFFAYGQYDSWRVAGQQTATAQIRLQEEQLQQALAEKVDPVTRKLMDAANWNVYYAIGRVRGMSPDEQMALVTAPGFSHLLPMISGGAGAADLERSSQLDVTLLVLGDLDPDTVALVETGAQRFMDLGEKSTGPASAEAFVQAAELYRVTGNTTQRAIALGRVIERGDGAVKYAAIVATAGMAADAGKVDEGIASLRPYETNADRFLAQDAMLQIGALLEAAGRNDEALAEYRLFLEKYADTPMSVEAKARKARLAPGEVDAPAGGEGAPAGTIPAGEPKPENGG